MNQDYINQTRQELRKKYEGRDMTSEEFAVDFDRILFTTFEAGREEGKREAIKVCQEYIDLLEEEGKSFIGLAIAHGWSGDGHAFNKGVELRAKIASLTNPKTNNKI